jgi:hypothetical protein
MEVTHSHLTEIACMVFVHVCTVVVLAAGEAPASWMFPVLADSTMASGHMPTTLLLSANMII